MTDATESATGARVDRAWCLEADARDSLAGLRRRFVLPEGIVYLDGNSLGPLPRAVPERIDRVLREEWGQGLVRSWMSAGWIDMAIRLGERLAPLVGAGPGQVLACDTTTINLHKLLLGALRMTDRRVILTEKENFHTDLYAAAGVAAALGAELRIVPRAALDTALDDSVAVVLLTHVDYRSGEMHDMPAMTEAAHRAGALMLWDLCHSVGAVPLHLDQAGADLAVGCCYKYLNGGPGAPAFLYVAERHQERLDSPLRGWLGHASPFAFETDYTPAAGIRRHLISSPSILGMAVLDVALDVFDDATLAAVREKSLALTSAFIDLVETRCAGQGLRLVTPRDPGRRGSQVSLAHPDAYGIVQALIERGVIGDFRVPDVARFGFTPLYLRFVDVLTAVDTMVDVMQSGAHRDPRFADRARVT